MGQLLEKEKSEIESSNNVININSCLCSSDRFIVKRINILILNKINIENKLERFFLIQNKQNFK